MKIKIDEGAVERVVVKALHGSLKRSKDYYTLADRKDVDEYRAALRVVLSWWEP